MTDELTQTQNRLRATLRNLDDYMVKYNQVATQLHQTPVVIRAFILEDKEDESALARFANTDRAEQYAVMLLQPFSGYVKVTLETALGGPYTMRPSKCLNGHLVNSSGVCVNCDEHIDGWY